MSLQVSDANKSLIVCLIVIISAIILGCAGGRSKSNTASNTSVNNADRERWKNQDALNAKEKEYTALPQKIQLTNEPYIKGKIVLYKASPSFTELQNPMLSSGTFTKGEEAVKSLIAISPDQVGTVVLVGDNTKTGGCKEISKGYYKDKETEDTISSYIESCELTIIDLSIPAVIHRKTFEGKLKDTMYVRKDKGSILGRVDYDEVYSYISGLPRR